MKLNSHGFRVRYVFGQGLYTNVHINKHILKAQRARKGYNMHNKGGYLVNVANNTMNVSLILPKCLY